MLYFGVSKNNVFKCKGLHRSEAVFHFGFGKNFQGSIHMIHNTKATKWTYGLCSSFSINIFVCYLLHNNRPKNQVKVFVKIVYKIIME